jgi:hypothetical protein
MQKLCIPQAQIGILLSIIIVFSPELCATPTAKTFYQAPSTPLWYSYHAVPFQEKTPQPNDSIQNAFGITGFYWRSTEKKKLGNYFGFYDDTSETTCNFLRVTADTSVATSLIPQDIIHNAALSGSPNNTTLNPLKETITFNPYIEYYGFTTTNSVRIGNWLTIHTSMPWMKKRHVLGMKSTDSIKTIVEDHAKGVMDFFTGNLSQEDADSKNQQDRLEYGKLKESQTVSGLAGIVIQCLFSPEINDEVSAHFGFTTTLPTNSRAQGLYLFEPLMGNGGHATFGICGDVNATLGTIKQIHYGIGAHGILQAGLAGHEVRSPSFLIAYDSGVDAQFARYALAGKQNARRLFPLINMLTQMVNVKPGTSIAADAHVWASYKKIMALFEYRYTYTTAEKITPLFPWPSNTYAVSRLSYAQTNTVGDVTTYRTFNIPDHSTLINSASLKEEAIYYDAAATPTQATHTLGLMIEATPLAQYPNSKITVYGHYSFSGSELFGIGGSGISCSLSHTF